MKVVCHVKYHCLFETSINIKSLSSIQRVWLFLIHSSEVSSPVKQDKEQSILTIPGTPSSGHRSSTCLCPSHSPIDLLWNVVHLEIAAPLCSMTRVSGEVSYRFLERPIGGCMPPPPCNIQLTHHYFAARLTT